MEKTEKGIRIAEAYGMSKPRLDALRDSVARSRAALEDNDYEDYMMVQWKPIPEKPNAVQSWLER